MRVMLDTNVLVSVALVAKGASAYLVELWRDGELEIIVTEALIEEVVEVLRRPHIRRRYQVREPDIQAVQHAMRRHGLMVPGVLEVEAVEDDPDDNTILAAAIEGEARYVVTGDQHLLRLGQFQGIPILPPEQLRSLLQEEP